ncbi:hypothetical protein V5O48_013822 [Marasmius crinis-equi]|uniref:Uncharacterized protein n=1 Tax=Marasmius crinis-equi TaxID=585013 RepID=A0ABR3EZ18_9AGAR
MSYNLDQWNKITHSPTSVEAASHGISSLTSPASTTVVNTSARQPAIPAGSWSTSVGPIMGSVLGGIFGAALIVCALWLHSRKRSRARRPVFDFPETLVDPLPSGREAKTRRPHLSAGFQELVPQLRNPSETHVSIAVAFIPDARVVAVPATSDGAAPAVPASDDTSDYATEQFGVGNEVFTTNELVLELNQEVQTGERWNSSESLLGCPESEIGRAY